MQEFIELTQIQYKYRIGEGGGGGLGGESEVVPLLHQNTGL